MAQNIVLGAGIAGLAAAWTAKRLGRPAVVYEAAARAGGLLDNFEVDGFLFDTAVHLSFGGDADMREVFDATPSYVRDAKALCWDDGRWLRHPVQNNLYPLPDDEKAALIEGLRQGPREPRNYREWLASHYGKPIADRWYVRYTEKYWTIPPEEMGLAWVDGRFRLPDLDEVRRGAYTDDRTNTYHIQTMRYPVHGGFRSYLEPMISELDIRCGRKVVQVDASRRTVDFSDGSSTRYDNVVSTMPLPDLIDALRDVPARIRALASSLFATSLDLVSVGFRRADVSPCLWFYIYDEDIWAARAHAPGLKSPNNVPAGCSSLQFEIYSSRRRPQTYSVDALEANTLAGVKKMGLASDADVVFVHHKLVSHANVVFDLGMEERRDEVLDWVARQGIAVAGRFGEWAYLWSNHAWASGSDAARRAFR